MPFPIALALAAASAGASLFGPKQNNNTPNIAGQIDAGGKFNDVFSMLQQQSAGGGGALSPEEMKAFIDNLFKQAEPGLNDLQSQAFSGQARRGVADSRLGAFNVADVTTKFNLQTANQAQDLIRGNALQGFQGRQNATNNLVGLVGQGLGNARAADVQERGRSDRFSQGLSSLTGALGTFFGNKNKG